MSKEFNLEEFNARMERLSNNREELKKIKNSVLSQQNVYSLEESVEELDDYYFNEMAEIRSSYIKEFLESGNRRDKKDDCVTEIGLAIEHLLKMKYCTNDRNYRVWENSFLTHIGAYSLYTKSLSKKENIKLIKYIKENIQRSYDIGVKNYKNAAKKYPDLKDGVKYIPPECKWSLEELTNLNVTIEELLAKLPDME